MLIVGPLEVWRSSPIFICTLVIDALSGVEPAVTRAVHCEAWQLVRRHGYIGRLSLELGAFATAEDLDAGGLDHLALDHHL